MPYTACTPRNCTAVANLAADFQATLMASSGVKATIYATDGKGLTFTFSAKGLADALKELGAAPANP